jgi:lysophospholipase L1-like esterase
MSTVTIYKRGLPSWDPSQAPETFFFVNPSTLSGAENDVVASLPNLADSRGLLASVTGTNCKLRNIRGVPAVWMSSTSTLGALMSATVAQPVVVYMVVTSDVANGNNFLLGKGPGSAVTEASIRLTTTAWPRTVTAGASTQVSAGVVGPSVNQPMVIAVKFNGSSTKIYVDGVLVATGTSGSGVFQGFTIGNASVGGQAFAGLMGAVVAQLAPSDALIAQTIAYLQALYRTTGKRWQVEREGDSLTNGTGGVTGHGGYGYDLEVWGRSAPGGAYLDFIGSKSTQLTTYSNCHNYAQGGTDVVYHIDAVTGIQTEIGPGKNYHPNILDLRIGTNDVNATNRAYDGAARATDYATLLATIRTAEPQCRVIVHTIPPISGGGAGNVTDWNSRMAAVWTTEMGLGGKLHICDDWTAMGGVYNASLMSDSLHPNPAGYDLLLAAVKPLYLEAIAALG